MNKIKVLRIIARLNIGGPAMHAVILTEGLDKTHFESLLVCGNIDKNEGDMSYYAAQNNIKPVFIPELKRELNFINDTVAFIKIYKIIKAYRPDIIHTHTAKAGTLGRLAGLLFNLTHYFSSKRIRLVHTFHGHIFEGYFNKLQTYIFILIERFLAIFTLRIITVSESVKKEMVSLRIAGKDKIEVIPLGLEIEKFFDIPMRDNPDFNVGIVGRLVPIKNHRLFLEAASRVIRDNSGLPISFKIIGDGELGGELRDYARRLNIDKQIEFLGWQKDLIKVYADLDIVTLTSLNEGTPVSLIEAMAAARTVVATDVGGVRDLLGSPTSKDTRAQAGFEILERGIIVKSADTLGFANALGLILRDSAMRKATGEAARNFVRDRFTKERLIKDMEDLYNHLIPSA